MSSFVSFIGNIDKSVSTLVEIYSITGIKQSEFTLTSQGLDIDVSQYANGVYLLKVEGESFNKTQLINKL